MQTTKSLAGAQNEKMKTFETSFLCSQCGEEKPVQTSGGTGYALNDVEQKICYACCALNDAETMRTSNRITLYLSKTSLNGGTFYELTNWPGTLKIPAYHVRLGRHNIARTRTDVWFNTPDNQAWHGVQYGENTQICHCRKLKAA